MTRCNLLEHLAFCTCTNSAPNLVAQAESRVGKRGTERALPAENVLTSACAAAVKSMACLPDLK